MELVASIIGNLARCAFFHLTITGLA